MLEDVYNSVKNNIDFQNAVEILSDEYHTYPCESGEIFEEDVCAAYANDVGAALYNGVSKIVFCFDNYCLKTSFRGYARWDDVATEYYFDDNIDCDYCSVEYEIYKQAQEYGLQDFFAETIKVSPFVYMQEKYDAAFDVVSSSNEIEKFEQTTKEQYDKVKGAPSWVVAFAKDMKCIDLFHKIGSHNFIAFATFYNKEK